MALATAYSMTAAAATAATAMMLEPSDAALEVWAAVGLAAPVGLGPEVTLEAVAGAGVLVAGQLRAGCVAPSVPSSAAVMRQLVAILFTAVRTCDKQQHVLEEPPSTMQPVGPATYGCRAMQAASMNGTAARLGYQSVWTKLSLRV